MDDEGFPTLPATKMSKFRLQIIGNPTKTHWNVAAPNLALLGVGLHSGTTQLMKWSATYYENVFIIPGLRGFTVDDCRLKRPRTEIITAPLRKLAEPYKNLHVLCGNTFVIEDVMIAGCYWWPYVATKEKYSNYLSCLDDIGMILPANKVDEAN